MREDDRPSEFSQLLFGLATEVMNADVGFSHYMPRFILGEELSDEDFERMYLLLVPVRNMLWSVKQSVLAGGMLLEPEDLQVVMECIQRYEQLDEVYRTMYERIKVS